MSTKKKIIVTGGAGYIGSHTIIGLMTSEETEVISIDNYSNSSEKTYDRIEEITGKKPRYYNCDLCDEKNLRAIFNTEKNIDGIIHFAAFKSVPESVADPLLYYRNNILSLYNLLSVCRDENISCFIFSSSCSVYGNISKLPVNEETPLSKPESPYASTKIMGEQMMNDFSASMKGMSSVALRYFNPVGAHPTGLNGELPRNRPNNLFPVITQTAIGKLKEMTVFGNDYPTRDGTCIRDYVHVCDIAQAHVFAMNYLLNGKQTKPFDVMNLGTGDGVTVMEAIDAFEKATGIRPNVQMGARRAGDVVAIYSDCAKAKSLLGWNAATDLNEMVSSSWKWEQHLKKEI
ncbi:MAG: UDP-glucose 4-epimerase GalE [Bacteroidetes bacterium]|nr:UDP-glucose 4-epimerase GalE [Bacteroidota bacterium]